MNDSEFLEYCYKELSKGLEKLGDVNLAVTYRPKVELAKLHSSYDILHNLHKKIRKRMEAKDE